MLIKDKFVLKKEFEVGETPVGRDGMPDYILMIEISEC